MTAEEKLLYDTDSPDMAIADCAIAELGKLNSPDNILRILAKVHRIRIGT